MRKVGTQNWGGEECPINKASADPWRKISEIQPLPRVQHEFRGSWEAEKYQGKDCEPWVQTT